MVTPEHREMNTESAEDSLMERCEGMIFDVDRFSVNDGPGIRMTVFLKGCPLHCQWCHSPESRRMSPQLLYQKSRCTDCHACFKACPSGVIECREEGISIDHDACRECFTCALRCPAGALRVSGYTAKADQIISMALRDKRFYLASGGGITLSGGEPLMQPAFSTEIISRCHRKGIHTAMETCGYGSTEALMTIARDIDLILFDVKLMNPEKHRFYTGVSNELILANLSALCTDDALRSKVYVRVPLIPGINDTPEDILAVAEMLKSLSVKRMDVLPYNPLAAEKYAWTGEVYPYKPQCRQTTDDVLGLKAMLSEMGFSDQWSVDDGTEPA